MHQTTQIIVFLLLLVLGTTLARTKLEQANEDREAERAELEARIVSIAAEADRLRAEAALCQAILEEYDDEAAAGRVALDVCTADLRRCDAWFAQREYA